MKRFFLFLMLLMILVFAAGIAQAEWLVCDIPNAAEQVTEYAVSVDGAPEVIVPYQENADNTAVLLWDITSMDTANFSIYAINSQGRRSTVPAPFSLLSAPSTPSGARIIQP